MPEWASQVIALYSSNAASQFILYGNVNDRVLFPASKDASPSRAGSLADFFLHGLLPTFDVVFSYDIANGLRVDKGGETFCKWQGFKERPELPKAPRPAIELLTRYFRYCANLSRISGTQERLAVGCIIKAAHLLAPASSGFSYDLDSLALLMREWANDPLLTEHPLVTCLLTDNLNDLHPLLATNARAARIKLPLPAVPEIAAAISLDAPRVPTALGDFANAPGSIAEQLAGATLNSIDAMLKLKEYRKERLLPADLVALKKQIVEDECQGLIEFIQSKRTLDDLHGQEEIKTWLRQDIALWRQGDLQALPMGYLLAGPVGTGKTFMVDCLAGEAGVPVVKIRNFRDKWVGSTEGNLEKIFRLLQALNRCYVFVDEADQALGKREGGADDGGLSGRIYSMIAAEMSRPENRGRIIWILASSRPDLIEVDLKRPGRIDVKIPIFPTSTPEESWGLIRTLAKRRGIDFADADFEPIKEQLPMLLTPGAAEALAVKLYRTVKTGGATPRGAAVSGSFKPIDALRQCLEGYRNPVPRETLDFQIQLAVAEASDVTFVPAAFR